MLRRTEIPKISAKRRAELIAAFGYIPATTWKPTRSAPKKAKRWTDTGPDKNTVEVVLNRDRYRCACCAAPTGPAYGRRGLEWSIAHRKLRAQGGSNDPSNLYLSCGNGAWGCEAETHRFPQKSRDAGRMLLSTQDPEQVPMVHAVLGGEFRVLLDNSGGWVQAEGAGA